MDTARNTCVRFIFKSWTVGICGLEGGSAHEPMNTSSERIEVDEQNCFGMIEWSSVRNSAGSLLPKNAAEAGWKHRALSFVRPLECRPGPGNGSI